MSFLKPLDYDTEWYTAIDIDLEIPRIIKIF